MKTWNGVRDAQPSSQLSSNYSAASQEAALVDHPTNHGSTKHIDVRYHFLRDRMKLGQIVVEYVKTSENVADAFTKALGAANFGGFVDELGMS